MFGIPTIPLAMIVAGARIAMIDHSGLAKINVWILCFLRLIIIPLIGFVILKFIPVPIFTKQIVSVVFVMPVAIASIMLSEIFGGDKNFMTVTVFASHIVAIVSVPVMLSLYIKFI